MRDEVTQLLQNLQDSEEESEIVREQLYSLLYHDLRSVARSLMRSERPDHTLQPTALVHEAYFRLAGGTELAARDRAQFFAVATRAMRQILIDHARKRAALKRKACPPPGELGAYDEIDSGLDDPFLAIEDGLQRLETLHPRVARVAEMRIIGGMTHEEIASVLNVSRRTIAGDWSVGKRWLGREIERL